MKLATLHDTSRDGTLVVVSRGLERAVAVPEIARTLHLSIKTVDTHRAHIRQKLGLRNGTELIHHATRWTAEQG